MEEKSNSKNLFEISPAAATRLLGMILLLTAFRGALYIVSIPPWQSPDEPTHFEYARVLALGGNIIRPQPDPELQGRIIRSMDRFDYWRLVFVDAPDPLPRFFGETPFLQVAPTQMDKNPPLYYLAASLLLRPGRERSLLGGLYQLRILSLIFTLVTIVVVFAAAREFVPGRSLFHLAAAVFAAFLPQFMVIGTSVSPDPLINLLGAVLILLVIRSFRLERRLPLLVSACCLFGLGALTSYKFLILLPPLALWLAVLYASVRPGYFIRRFLVALAAGLAAAAALAALSPRLIQVYSKRLGDLVVILRDFINGEVSPPPGYWAWFNRELFKSTWLKFGWLKFEFAPGVYTVLRAATAASAAGVVWTTAKTALSVKKWKEGEAGPLIILVAFALSVLVSYYCFWGLRFDGTTTQGRHFFIALPAGAILIVLGWGALLPRRWRNPSYLVFIAGMVILDLAALFGYIRPTFV